MQCQISKINLDFKKFKFEKLSGRLNLVKGKLSKFVSISFVFSVSCKKFNIICFVLFPLLFEHFFTENRKLEQ